MAKVFNGSMWNGIGNGISNRFALEDAQRNEAMQNAANASLGVEKMIANNNTRKAIMDYYRQMQDAADERSRAEDIAYGEMVDDQIERENALSELAGLGNLDEGLDDDSWMSNLDYRLFQNGLLIDPNNRINNKY